MEFIIFIDLINIVCMYLCAYVYIYFKSYNRKVLCTVQCSVLWVVCSAVVVFILLCFYGAGCCAISAVVHAFY